jgi:DNA helicase-2/ATP-dependent DNA helicase PcrA
MYLDQLNESQKQAVTLPLGPALIIAGPGSGKTHTLIHRISYMLQELNCKASHMLVITFTKAAATEMKERFEAAFGRSGVMFGTFHSAFYKILRMHNKERYDLNNLLTEDERRKTIEKIYRAIAEEVEEDFIELFLKHMTLMSNQLIKPQHYHPDGIAKEIFLKVYEGYERFKENHQKFDFDDMLIDTYFLLENEPEVLAFFRQKYQYLLIDEFQDINVVQFEIIKLLTTEHRNVFVVGDDDQSIYKFRGARPELLVSFKEFFEETKEVVLDINYRSTKKILDWSNELILHNQKRYNKVMRTIHENGNVPRVVYIEDIKSQASFILETMLKFNKEGLNWSDCAIIYRTNVEARPLLELFLSAHIPFYLRDTIATLYDSWVTKDLFAYIRLGRKQGSNADIIRIINRPTRYMHRLIIEQAAKKNGNLLETLLASIDLKEWQKDPLEMMLFHLQNLGRLPMHKQISYIRHQIGYEKYLEEYAKYRHLPKEGLIEILDELEASASEFEDSFLWEQHLEQLAKGIRANNQNPSNRKEGVTLTTMHSAKGLEFKMVFILDVVDGVLPHSKSQTPSELEEERRLFYVALTRAKTDLFLCVPKVRHGKETLPSPFIAEILVGQLKPQTKIKHARYGTGVVVEKENQHAKIHFQSGQIKMIDCMYCLKNDLIKVEA